MDDLIAALNILRKYLPDTNKLNPTNCQHDVMWIMDVDPDDVTDADRDRLADLGFLDSGEEAFCSHRFGSA